MPDRRTIAHEWFDRVWNKQNATAIDELLARDASIHGLSDAKGAALKGSADFKQFHAMLLAAFPDLHVEVEDTIAQDDLVAVRCVVTGTHRGGLGFEATNTFVRFTGMSFVRVQNGQIVEGWNNFDFESVSAQLRSAVDKAGPVH